MTHYIVQQILHPKMNKWIAVDKFTVEGDTFNAKDKELEGYKNKFYMTNSNIYHAIEIKHKKENLNENS